TPTRTRRYGPACPPASSKLTLQRPFGRFGARLPLHDGSAPLPAGGAVRSGRGRPEGPGGDPQGSRLAPDGSLARGPEGQDPEFGRTHSAHVPPRRGGAR